MIAIEFADIFLQLASSRQSITSEDSEPLTLYEINRDSAVSVRVVSHTAGSIVRVNLDLECGNSLQSVNTTTNTSRPAVINKASSHYPSASQQNDKMLKSLID